MTILLVLLSIMFCSAQRYSPLINDTLIEDFIKWKLYQDTFKNINVSKEYFEFSSSILAWKPIELKRDSSASVAINDAFCIFNTRNKWLDTILTSDDRAFMMQQTRFSREGKWQFKPKVNPKAEKGSEYNFSVPLFSVDKQYALLKETYWCGEDCGEYRIMLYKY